MLIPLLLIVGGAVLLVVGGEILVRGASGIASLLGIPPLIVGLTIVAACTSAPEMAVSLTGLLVQGSSDIAVGNVVGSNIMNILLILGVAAVICPIGVSSQLIRREIPLLVVLSGVTWWFASFKTAETHLFPRWGGVVFLLVFLLYNGWVVRSVHAERDKELVEGLTERNSRSRRRTALRFIEFLSLFLVGMGMLIYGSNVFVRGAVDLAKLAGISELVISLTILAVGTSLPELVVSVVAAFRGKCDIAIGNVIGSNTFNLLAILGATATLSSGGLTLSQAVFYRDLPVMVGTAVLASVLCITGKKLSRMEGLVLVAAYGGYVGMLIYG